MKHAGPIRIPNSRVVWFQIKIITSIASMAMRKMVRTKNFVAILMPFFIVSSRVFSYLALSGNA